MGKPFCFTYTKLKSYETCGLQHQHQEYLKTPGMQPSGDAIDFGNKVHKALEDAIKWGLQKGGAPLPPRMKFLQYWVDYCLSLPGEKWVEEKWALNRDRVENDYFRNPWYRLKVDFAHVCRPAKYGHLIDWKTGKRLDEPLQLWLGAACMFEQFPKDELDTIESMFIWLKEFDENNITEETLEQCISTEIIKRSEIRDIWDSLLPRIATYEDAVASGVFLPKPGRHCQYCRLQSCEFWGKGR